MPREVVWDPSTLTFFIQKCFDDVDDPDCKGVEPFTINRDIIVFIILDDGTNQVVESLEFRVSLFDPCLFDTIGFTDNLGLITYAVSPSGTPYSPEGVPTFAHTYSLCPTRCYLTMPGGDPVSDPLALSLGLELIANPQPVLTIATSNMQMVGLTVDLEIACYSMHSDTDPNTPGLQNSFDIDSFRIEVIDACSTVSILPAESSDSYLTLYEPGAIGFSSP